MRLLDAFDFAITQLVRNLRRSAVAALGLLIGVAALLALETLGRATSFYLTGFIEHLGKARIIRVRVLGTKALGGGARPFTEADLERVRREYPHVAGVTAAVIDWDAQVAFRRALTTTHVAAMDGHYLDVFGLAVATGRPFSAEDEGSHAAVAVLGAETCDRLFGSDHALGAVVVAEGVPVTVVGVLEPTLSEEWNNTVYVPLASAMARFAGCRKLNAFYVAADDTAHVRGLADQLRHDLRSWAPGGLQQYEVDVNKTALQQITDSLLVLRVFVWAVSLVTLALGGIGIMNVFLALVTERSAEMGIRKAVGATEAEIALQVMVEASVLCLAASSAGVALGALVIRAVVLITGEPELAALSVPHVVAVVAFAVLVGLAFSLSPALRAARKDVVEAIRSR